MTEIRGKLILVFELARVGVIASQLHHAQKQAK